MQHEGLEAETASDIGQGRWIAAVLAWIDRWLDYTVMVNALCDAHAVEADLNREASHLLEVKANLARACVSAITPEVIASSRRVLILSHCDAPTLEAVTRELEAVAEADESAEDSRAREVLVARSTRPCGEGRTAARSSTGPSDQPTLARIVVEADGEACGVVRLCVDGPPCTLTPSLHTHPLPPHPPHPSTPTAALHSRRGVGRPALRRRPLPLGADARQPPRPARRRSRPSACPG